jgi:predicted RNA-binding Zn ribbon-like protein
MGIKQRFSPFFLLHVGSLCVLNHAITCNQLILFIKSFNIMHNNSFDRYKDWQLENYENREQFPMEGDIVILKFINTKRMRQSLHTKDHLKNYQDFLIWAIVMGVIDEETYDTLSLENYGNKHAAEKIFPEVINFRDALYDIIHNYLHRRVCQPAAINIFNSVNREAGKCLQFITTEDGPEQTWVKMSEEFEFPLWKVVKLAEKFILSDDLKRVKMCDCGNLFTDSSRRKNRGWCSAACRSSHWSRLYYGRRKELIG